VTLWQQFLTNNGPVVHKWKHYFPAYETHFARFVNRPVVFLEIGVSRGGSVNLWKQYLGPHAQIVGIDVDPACGAFEDDQIAIRIGDQSDSDFLQSIVDEFGPPNAVLDDGSHVMRDLLTTFRFMYPRTAKDGVYFVEDLHTAYWEEYGGGLKRSESFIEISKGLIDELNADWTRGEIEPTEFTRSTLSMHFYDSCVAFERGRHLNKSAPRIGADSR
jgi:hypothetical protein